MRLTVGILLGVAVLAGCKASDTLASSGLDGSIEDEVLATGGSASGQDGAVAMSTGDGATMEPEAEFEWNLPRGFPAPKVPEDNPMSVSKVELGRRLFYDKRLSENGTQSCASCHEQKRAFTDGKPVGIGSTGEAHPRGPMSLANVGYATTLTWVNPVVRTLERQALVPLFGADPVELGFEGKEDVLLKRVADEPIYQSLFQRAFPDADEPVSLGSITKAIAAFQRTLISGSSAYDQYLYGDAEALSDSARRGMDLFFEERMECFHCHGGFNFTDSETHEDKAFDEVAFHNTGLYNIDGAGAYPADNLGLFNFTAQASDTGRFKAPTLRNVAVTAPYMHDGSIATLGDVIDHYAAGGRTVESGPNAGVGSLSPYKSGFVPGFEITEAEKADLIEFLRSLTDETFLADPRFSDPWE